MAAHVTIREAKSGDCEEIIRLSQVSEHVNVLSYLPVRRVVI